MAPALKRFDNRDRSLEVGPERNLRRPTNDHAVHRLALKKVASLLLLALLGLTMSSKGAKPRQHPARGPGGSEADRQRPVSSTVAADHQRQPMRVRHAALLKTPTAT